MNTFYAFPTLLTRTAHLVSLVAALALAACSGGGGSSSTTSLASMSELEGTYKLVSLDSASSRSVENGGVDIYAMVAPPYFALYGLNDACFEFYEILSEQSSDSGLQVNFGHISYSYGLPSCQAYLSENVSFARSTAQEVDTQIAGTVDVITAGMKIWIPVIDFTPGGTIWWETYRHISNGKPLFDDTVDPKLVIAVFLAGLLDEGGSGGSGSGGGGDTGGDNDSGDTGSDDGDSTGTPTQPPSVTDSCVGVQHETGESYVTVCLQYTNAPEGTQVEFTFSGAGSVKSVTGQVDADGKVCFTATIYYYPTDYSWRAEISTSAGMHTETGDVMVTEAESSCSL